MKTRLLFMFLPLLFALPTAAAECPSLLDHRYTTLQGGTVNLCDFADRPILAVNTASTCGFTPQFEKLEGMYKKDKDKDKGMMVVGFPSNDFRQELATNKEIGEFCRLTYHVQFPMIEKSGHARGSRPPRQGIARGDRPVAPVEFPQVPDRARRQAGVQLRHPRGA